MADRAPVAFFIFNRPELTAQAFSAIAAARPPRLLVVGDGPRPGHPDDPDQVRQARGVIERVDWPCQLSTCYSDVNLGCKQRLASGLDWVFSEVESAVIIEDDCVPDPSFFRFCEELLERYRDEPRVHMIAGCNVLAPRSFTQCSYYFSHCYHIWGWASWARAWAHYDLQMTRWPELRDTRWLRRLLGSPIQARIARRIFDETHAGKVPTWDFQWVFSSWLAGGLAIVPSVNLVSNIGYGEQATHERAADHPLANLPREAMTFPLRHPRRVAPLREADRAEWAGVYPDFYRSAGLGERLRGALRDRRLPLGRAL